MKTTTLAKLYATLATLAPSIAFTTLWEHDQYAKWEADPSLDRDDFQAWESTVTARAIVGGNELAGEAHLCGTWLPFGDDPAKTDPEIGGYLLQKLQEAAQDVGEQIGEQDDALLAQANAASGFLQKTMRAEYDANMGV